MRRGPATVAVAAAGKDKLKCDKMHEFFFTIIYRRGNSEIVAFIRSAYLKLPVPHAS